jgi:epsilon-lactone hydrolase
MSLKQTTQLPSRDIPLPPTVSAEMRELMRASQPASLRNPPNTVSEWAVVVTALAQQGAARAPQLMQRFNVRVDRVEIAGVPAFDVVPDDARPGDRRRLMHIHGGCYVLNPGEAGLAEAILMAGFGKYSVLSVDYRMPPAAYFPAAHDDVAAVWTRLASQGDPKAMGVFGTSAGGALTLALAQRARRENLPLPAALAIGTPMADTTKTGDTFYTNEGLDNVLLSRDGFCDAATRLYANGHDLADPRLSPIYGAFEGLPPTILTSGTRDLLLSNTVRVHRKLRQAGVEAVLQVFEGLAHAQYLFDENAPETKEVFDEIVLFFDRHLAR